MALCNGCDYTLCIFFTVPAFQLKAHYAWIKLKEQLNIRVLWSYNNWFKIEQIKPHQYFCMVHDVKHNNPAYVYPWVKAVFHHHSGDREVKINQCHQKIQTTVCKQHLITCCMHQQHSPFRSDPAASNHFYAGIPLNLRKCVSAKSFTITEPSYFQGIYWNVAVTTNRMTLSKAGRGSGKMLGLKQNFLCIFKL